MTYPMDEQRQLDKAQVRRSFARAAADYDAVAVLQHEIGRRMIERLDVMRISPTVILDLGCGTGQTTELLMRRFPGARVVALDFAMPMLSRARRRGRWLRRPACLCADLDSLPLAAASVDLVFANASLQWSASPIDAFRDIARVLRPEGLLLFTTFGPDTLFELREAWREVDSSPRVNSFIDLHDYGDMLGAAGLADPVVDVERMALTYPDVSQLLREIKSLGATNADVGRQRGLLGRGRLARFKAAYERFRQSDGRYPASYEVVHGHAWAPLQRRVDGETLVSVDALRRR
jgi:malonyl-CoA O-methyltransferase